MTTEPSDSTTYWLILDSLALPGPHLFLYLSDILHSLLSAWLCHPGLKQWILGGQWSTGGLQMFI